MCDTSFVATIKDSNAVGAQPYIPPAPAPALDPSVAANPPPAAPVVEAPPAPIAEAEAPRKAIAQKLSLMARVLKGAAMIGLAAGLLIGAGAVWTKMGDHQPVKAPVQIEVPIEQNKPQLPQPQAPPVTGEKQIDAQTDTAPGSLPQAPTVKPTFDPGAVQGDRTLSPDALRLPRTLPGPG